MAKNELFVDQASVGSTTIDYYHDQTDRFIKDLVENYIPSLHGKYAFEAKRLDYNFNIKRIGILIRVNDFIKEYLSQNSKSYQRDEVIKEWKSKINECMDKFFTNGNDIITSYLGNGYFFVLKNIQDSEHEKKVVGYLTDSFESIFINLGKKSLEKVRVGISTSCNSLDKISCIYNEAETALRLGMKLEPNIQSHHIDSFGIIAAIADGDFDRKLYLSKKILEPINEEMIETLKKYFNNDLSIKRPLNK